MRDRESMRACDVRYLPIVSAYARATGIVAEAVREGVVNDLGTLAEQPSTPKRKPAHFYGFETLVDLCGGWYRAWVVHSDAYDERRIKKLERTLEKDRSEIEQKAQQKQKIPTSPVNCNAAMLCNSERILDEMWNLPSRRPNRPPQHHLSRQRKSDDLCLENCFQHPCQSGTSQTSLIPRAPMSVAITHRPTHQESPESHRIQCGM